MEISLKPLSRFRGPLLTSISQTSTYLAGTMKTQHDAMRQFDARRAPLQPLATDVGTGGQRRPQLDTKALFMTVWRPSTRSAEHSCGIRQG